MVPHPRQRPASHAEAPLHVFLNYVPLSFRSLHLRVTDQVDGLLAVDIALKILGQNDVFPSYIDRKSNSQYRYDLLTVERSSIETRGPLNSLRLAATLSVLSVNSTSGRSCWVLPSGSFCEAEAASAYSRESYLKPLAAIARPLIRLLQPASPLVTTKLVPGITSRLCNPLILSR